MRPSGEQWHVLGSTGGTGHYVGNFLFAEQDQSSPSFLEGDDLVVVDGADSLHGTGVENAYNGGFYYNWTATTMLEPEGASPASAIRPLCGILRVERTTTPAFARADQYRCMIADRVPFQESLLDAVETLYASTFSPWRSAVFWYQLPPPAPGVGTPDVEPRAGMRLVVAPNPALERATLRFMLARRERVVVEVFDVAGRRVGTLRDGFAVGAQELALPRPASVSGVYFIRVSAGAVSQTCKVTFVE